LALCDLRKNKSLKIFLEIKIKPLEPFHQFVLQAQLDEEEEDRFDSHHRQVHAQQLKLEKLKKISSLKSRKNSNLKS
jgi:hypothetical protein